MELNQINKSNLISRDLSWLNFNYRVLDLAKNNSRGILDRLKFLSIVASNFDEFFDAREEIEIKTVRFDKLFIIWS